MDAARPRGRGPAGSSPASRARTGACPRPPGLRSQDRVADLRQLQHAVPEEHREARDLAVKLVSRLRVAAGLHRLPAAPRRPPGRRAWSRRPPTPRRRPGTRRGRPRPAPRRSSKSRGSTGTPRRYAAPADRRRRRAKTATVRGGCTAPPPHLASDVAREAAARTRDRPAWRGGCRGQADATGGCPPPCPCPDPCPRCGPAQPESRAPNRDVDFAGRRGAGAGPSPPAAEAGSSAAPARVERRGAPFTAATPLRGGCLRMRPAQRSLRQPMPGLRPGRSRKAEPHAPTHADRAAQPLTAQRCDGVKRALPALPQPPNLLGLDVSTLRSDHPPLRRDLAGAPPPKSEPKFF